ncbi:PC-esterase domain-containing protein 1B isoform X1 [Phyllostomus hastatus]|uniref:PC-esterase domain-containing protein 1B isoform X1 n=2 Tax=Phyllostomus hastatus TaxID=9423 RepID=UPI001E6846AB|nr:PC-esterase domain-containing protein 1B isoform X1 [Phyllostomus hastatus]XP_045685216.1 PC-esterase domain-containing protein 1B isoform X1 [Phyllostomus hastatus]XP_045685217.1 PC-esterase domain-containing protein 1B isoform X1 [Phyllostomus hastatus]XP_045685218.1 PC-esterase domain-containing protein 1B isoform X1 [Phyllostomus hastatus]XP_045685219.1 PC-esterase domain-containing protein 1B isoform X1 [Phyllostomus hastatus]XP_045685220.1 PC-esterase domain-containing protein 1B isof
MNTYLQTHPRAKEGARPLDLGIMAHLQSLEVQQLLHNKFVVILGDSVQRSVYKDLVLLLQKDDLLTYKQLKVKGELSFEQDKLVNGGQKAAMHNGTNYREVREFCTSHHLVRFYFLTRVYNSYVQGILKELQSSEHSPDVVIINSCLWDISRYGKDSFSSYRKNLENLFRHLVEVLPESCLLVWNTAMPVGEKITGGFLPRKQSSLSLGLKKKVIEANFYSFVEAQKHNFDVLDLHFHFRHAEVHRQGDGVHWNQWAHRHLSQLLLAHMADAWGVDLPCRQPVGQLIRSRPEQEVERQSQTSRKRQALLPSPSFSPRQHSLLPYPGPYVPLPPPLPPQPLPIPCHTTRRPHFLQGSQDASDLSFQSDQFFNHSHSDGPSSTQAGFDFEGGFMFDHQPPRVPEHTPYHQQWAPVVHRGFPQNVPHGPYAPWRQPPKSYRRQARAHPEPRPH